MGPHRELINGIVGMVYMHAMQLRAVDLNLLVVLDAILVTGSVKEGARRLALTPSATSHALGRLRELLDDPILVRAGRRMVPSPRAEAMRAELRALLDDIERVLDAGRPFDPARLERTFHLAGTGFTELFPFRALSRRLAELAPGVALQTLHVGPDYLEQARSGEYDLVLGVFRGGPADVRVEPVFEDRFVCLLRRGHPALRRKLTPARFAALDHVLVSPRGLPGSVVDAALERAGLRRRVARTVASFEIAPYLVADSDYVCTLPERVARQAAGALDVVVRPPPLALQPIVVSQGWHARHDRDPAHVWLREQVRAAA